MCEWVAANGVKIFLLEYFYWFFFHINNNKVYAIFVPKGQIISKQLFWIHPKNEQMNSVFLPNSAKNKFLCLFFGEITLQRMKKKYLFEEIEFSLSGFCLLYYPHNHRRLGGAWSREHWNRRRQTGEKEKEFLFSCVYLV